MMIDLTAYYRFVSECAQAPISDEQFVWLLTDIIYMHLFGMDGEGLRGYFELPQSVGDDAVRDCLGHDALLALWSIEISAISALAEVFHQKQFDVIGIVWRVAEAESKRIKAKNPNFSPNL
jgi:hypothetical protein